MNSNADLSILTLITQASPVVQVVLAILILLSLMSWTVIFRKFFAVSRAQRQTDEFETASGAAPSSRSFLSRPTATANPPAWKSASLPRA